MLSRVETDFLRGRKQAKPQHLRYLKHCIRRKIRAFSEIISGDRYYIRVNKEDYYEQTKIADGWSPDNIGRLDIYCYFDMETMNYSLTVTRAFENRKSVRSLSPRSLAISGQARYNQSQSTYHWRKLSNNRMS